MAIKVGSARHDENGAYTNGKAGDQTGTEVSTQTMYTHSKGWYILRLKDAVKSEKLAQAMLIACNNNNIGYDQNNRLGVVKKGITTATKTECDCSSLVRACLSYIGISVGNFTTANEATVLAKTGLFLDKFEYVSQAKTPVYNGDILVTKTKGHTVIVVSGSARKVESVTGSFYPKYTGSSSSIVDALKAVGVKDTTLAHRQKIAKANGISTLISSTMNIKLLTLLKAGRLRKEV